MNVLLVKIADVFQGLDDRRHLLDNSVHQGSPPVTILKFGIGTSLNEQQGGLFTAFLAGILKASGFSITSFFKFSAFLDKKGSNFVTLEATNSEWEEALGAQVWISSTLEQQQRDLLFVELASV